MNQLTYTTLIATLALLLSGIAVEDAKAESLRDRLRLRLDVNQETSASVTTDGSADADTSVETTANAETNVSAGTEGTDSDSGADGTITATAEAAAAVTAPQDDREDRRSFFARLKAKLEGADDMRTNVEVRVGERSQNEDMPPQDDRLERRGYLEAKLRHEAAVEKYRDLRESFLEIRARFRASQSAENRVELEARAEAFLRQTVNTMIQRLERIKEWAKNHPRVSDEVEATVVIKIDAEIAALNNAVATLPEDATLEQIQAVTAAVRNRFSFYKETIAEVVADIRVSRIRAAIDKATSLSGRVETALSEALAEGIDTTAAAAVFTSAKADLAAAKEKYGDADFKAAQELVLEAFKDMREVIVHLKAGAKINAE